MVRGRKTSSKWASGGSLSVGCGEPVENAWRSSGEQMENQWRVVREQVVGRMEKQYTLHGWQNSEKGKKSQRR